MSTDLYAGRAASAHAPARKAVAVTPNNDTDLSAVAKALYVGGPGDLTIIPAGGAAAVTLYGHPAGYAPIQVRRVLAAGTTATQIVALGD